MNFFKEWSFCVCITLIVSVLLSVFTPQGSMNRFYKIAISVFIFISFILPFKDFSVNAISFGKTDNVFEINEKADNAYENEINKQIEALLKENGVIGASVSSRVNYDFENALLEITEVNVYVPDEYSTGEIASFIFSEIGINAKVVNIGA